MTQQLEGTREAAIRVIASMEQMIADDKPKAEIEISAYNLNQAAIACFVPKLLEENGSDIDSNDFIFDYDENKAGFGSHELMPVTIFRLIAV